LEFIWDLEFVVWNLGFWVLFGSGYAGLGIIMNHHKIFWSVISPKVDKNPIFVSNHSRGAEKMRHYVRLSVLWGSVVLFLSILPSRFAYGDPITITPAETIVNLIEGSSTSDPVTITNNLSVSILVNGVGISTSIVLSGDPSDGISATPDFSCVGQTIVPNGTCTFHIDITTDSPADESDYDFGISTISNIFAEFLPLGGTTARAFSTSSIQVTVSDVPEPATMLLLSSGLIGLAGYGRKKFFKK
jgi:hypothetical protein